MIPCYFVKGERMHYIWTNLPCNRVEINLRNWKKTSQRIHSMMKLTAKVDHRT